MFPYCCRWSTAIFATIGIALVSVALVLFNQSNAKDQPPAKSTNGDLTMFGGDPSRNLVNTTAKNVPTEWQVEEKYKNIKWMAKLGTRAYGGPIIANGKVYVGTNNDQPRDPNVKGAKAILMCFNEADGKFLWQNAHDMPPLKIVDLAKDDGLCSTPTVDGDRIYYLAPDAELVCADANTGKEIWKLEMRKKFGVYPCFVSSGSPLVVGDTVYVVTGNGTDAATGKLIAPEAPAFLAADKKTGEVKWKSNLPGKNTIEGQWSNPVYAKINGVEQIIFPGGDSYLYSFERGTNKLLWKFHCNPKEEEAQAKKRGIPNYLVATPVIHNDHLYVGVGLYPEHPIGTKIGHFWCVDLKKATALGPKNKDNDVSPKKDNFDPKADVNKDSALAWHYGGELNPRPKFGRTAVFGRTLSTASVYDGLAYVAEEYGFLHCLDAKTGEKYWVHDFKTGTWGSSYWVDNKVYMGTEDGDMVIFAHGKVKKIINTIYMEEPIQVPAAVANGTLYVMTKTKLYAIGDKK